MISHWYTSSTWENGSLKDVVSSDHKIFSHIASRSRITTLLFGNSRHAFTWCRLCNGFLYATLPYRTALLLHLHQKLLFSVASHMFSCLIFVVYWCPISQAESRKYMFTISVSPSGLLDLIFQDRDNGLRVIPEMVFGNMTRLLRSTFSCLHFSSGCGFSIGLMKRMVLALGIGFSYHLQNLVMVPPPSFHFLNVRSLKLSSGQTISILCTLLPHLLQLAHMILLWYSEACTSWPTCIFSSLVVRCRCHMPFCSNQYFVSQPHFSQLDCIFWQVMAICKA